jgi:hypothetical protein
MNKLIEQLAEPFAPEDIEWRVGATNKDKTKGMALPYITARAAMNRYDSVMGPENWRDEYIQIQGGFLGGISLRIDGEWITKWDAGSDSDIEPIKGGVSDAYKRASVKWGMGRYLYEIPIQWVPIEPMGRSWKLSKIPSLPAWALPNHTKHSASEGKERPNEESFSEGVVSEEPQKLINRPLDPIQRKTEEIGPPHIDCIRKELSNAISKRNGRGVSEEANKLTHHLLQQAFPDQAKRHEFCKALFHVDNWSDMSTEAVGGLLDWLAPEKKRTSDGSLIYILPQRVQMLIQSNSF